MGANVTARSGFYADYPRLQAGPPAEHTLPSLDDSAIVRS